MSYWYVYMVRCRDNTLYTGVAKEVQKRVEAHNSAKEGAKYTRPRRPVCLVYERRCRNRSYAQKREAALKKLSRIEKEQLVAGT